MRTHFFVYRAFEIEFVRLYMFFSCAPMRSYAFLGIPMSSHEFSMHLNWPLLDIFRQSRVILWVFCGLESGFVVDLPIPCVRNVIASN